MNRLAFWLAAKLAGALEPHERDALRGDHAELGSSGAQALRDVLGLVIRRQLEPWKDWRPWLAASCGVSPFLVYAYLNLHFARLFAPNSPARFLYGDGPSYSGLLFVGSILLLGGLGSWACGFVVSSFSQRARVVNLGLLLIAWLFALTLTLLSPRFQLALEEQQGRLLIAVAFHLIVFAAPAVAGLLRGRKSQYLTFSSAVRLAGLLSLPTVATLAAVAMVDQARDEIGSNEILFIAFLSALHAWPSVPIILRSLLSRQLAVGPSRIRLS
jgi:hypothetical protein